jgi:hypothetical protein
MRRPVSRYDLLLRILGALAQALFIGMFICTSNCKFKISGS